MFWRLYRFPRIELFRHPTPLEKARWIGREYGVDVYVKRDDVMELAFGGNKVRKLEYIFGDILSRGCDIVITRGSYYSNHVRLTAAAAAKHGLETVIVTYPPNPGVKLVVQGNVLLNKLFGAEIIEVEGPREADEEMGELEEKYRREGRKPYVIPVGGSTALGVFGYALAVYELFEQFRSLNRYPRYIIHATGTGTTQAGLLVGLKLLGIDDVEVIGIDVEKREREGEIADHIVELGNKALELLGSSEKISVDDVVIYREYTFGGYGMYNDELIEFIREVARKEGLVVEPVYTGKALYGLIDLIKRGVIKRGDTVAYIHTGGTPLVFQFQEQLIS